MYTTVILYYVYDGIRRLCNLFWDHPFLSRLFEFVFDFYKVFIFVHQHVFAPQTLDPLEKYALSLIYNFNLKHSLLN